MSRIIVLDYNVIDHLNRGNDTAAAALIEHSCAVHRERARPG